MPFLWEDRLCWRYWQISYFYFVIHDDYYDTITFPPIHYDPYQILFSLLTPPHHLQFHHSNTATKLSVHVKILILCRCLCVSFVYCFCYRCCFILVVCYWQLLNALLLIGCEWLSHLIVMELLFMSFFSVCLQCRFIEIFIVIIIFFISFSHSFPFLSVHCSYSDASSSSS